MSRQPPQHGHLLFGRSPSSWPAGQTERLTNTYEFSLGSGTTSLRWRRTANYPRPPLNCVTNPAAGFTPEAPQAIVASSTAPSACGFRCRYTRTTDRFLCPPSSWPDGQSERLAITFEFDLGSGTVGLRRRCPADYSRPPLTALYLPTPRA